MVVSFHLPEAEFFLGPHPAEVAWWAHVHDPATAEDPLGAIDGLLVTYREQEASRESLRASARRRARAIRPRRPTCRRDNHQASAMGCRPPIAEGWLATGSSLSEQLRAGSLSASPCGCLPKVRSPIRLGRPFPLSADRRGRAKPFAKGLGGRHVESTGRQSGHGSLHPRDTDGGWSGTTRRRSVAPRGRSRCHSYGAGPVSVDQRGSRVLEPGECRTLLALAAASPGVGRVALNADPSPHVIPVNFSIMDTGILVRLGAGWTAFHLDGVECTFEVDHRRATGGRAGASWSKEPPARCPTTRWRASERTSPSRVSHDPGSESSRSSRPR